MKRLYTICFLLSTITLVQCTSKKAASNEMSEAEKVTDVKKNFTPAQMDEGKVLWQNSCGKCHKLPQPESYTVSKFDRVLPRMIKKAKLTDEQGAKVRAYLIANAKMG
jgi:cytochrome c5